MNSGSQSLNNEQQSGTIVWTGKEWKHEYSVNKYEDWTDIQQFMHGSVKWPTIGNMNVQQWHISLQSLDKFTNLQSFSLYNSLIYSFIHSFIPLACAECKDSLLFSGASSIPLCYIPFPSTLFHQLLFHPLSLHLAIYFLVYLSALLFPNSYIILFLGILLSSVLCTCPNQHNPFNLTVSVIVGL